MRNKLRLSLILFSVIYWVLAALYFVTVRYAGHGADASPDMRLGEVIAYGAVVGFFIGLLFGLFPLGHFPYFKKRKSFLTVVMISTGCYILFFSTVIFFTSLYGNSLRFAWEYVFSVDGLTVLFHMSLASLFYHFILQINKKFGQGVLLEYTFGRYFSPKIEERVFMFLDLKSSTHLAEKLEHVSYTRMVQDCYAELSIPLVDHKAQVYQYVGDEVVVSWKINTSFNASSCCDFFYSFRKRLEEKKEYFCSKYGACPEFKAGVHCGKVTVAEVGEIKTEIAYHGDVLNTASRIQGLCNSLQQELLVSESFLQYLSPQDREHTAFVADVSLRGKEASTKVFTIASRIAT